MHDFHKYLQEQVVNGRLHFQSETVAGVILAEGELVINVEDGHGRDGRAGLTGLLVILTTLKDFNLQLLELCPRRQRYD